MAQLELQPAVAGTTKRKIHAALRIDMTPMVDLGFLLISFFIFTTTMAEKHYAKLTMPADGIPSDVAASKAMTVLLGSDDKVYVYEGRWETAVANNKIITTNYDEIKGFGSCIRTKQKWLQRHDTGGKKELVLVIKPSDQTSYQHFIDVMDDVIINDVKKYAVADLSAEERVYINNK